MIIAIHKHEKLIFKKNNLVGNHVELKDIKDESQITRYPIKYYHRDFIEWELIKGGK